MKGVVDKLSKETFTEMIKHSYFSSGLNIVTDVKRMFNHFTENKSMTISEELYKNTLERGMKKAHALVKWYTNFNANST